MSGAVASEVAGPLIALRADAGGLRGSGHVMRCLALARAWIARGGRATLLSAELPEALAARAEAWGVDVRRIAAPAASIEDAAQTAALAADASWLAIDGYDFSTAFLAAAGPTRRVVIDDVAALDAYPVDVVINQNAHASAAAYARSAPGARLLLGGRYALLRPEFAAPPTRERAGIFATFGGVDPHGASETFLAACAGRADVSLAIGAANARADALAAEASRCGVAAHRDVKDMAAAFAGAALVVTAGGSTLWEACACAAPMIVISVIPEEAASAQALAAQGGCVYLGPLDRMSPRLIGEAIDALMRDDARRAALGAAARAMVDGRGADRVAAALMAHAETPC